MLAFASSVALGLRHAGGRALCARSLTMSTPQGPVSSAVADVVKENPVVVFSKTWCSYSARAKGLLRDELDAKPVVWELDQMADGDAIQQELYDVTGQRTVPSIFIHQEHIGGCDDLMELYFSGELESKLKKT